MMRELVATVGLLWLVVGVVGCGQPAAEAGEGGAPMAEKSIDQVLQEQRDSLMGLPGVVGIALGLCSGELCIKVYVAKKTTDLLKQIPAQIEGYTVDVQETGEFKALDPG